MKDGFIRVAASTPEVKVADLLQNHRGKGTRSQNHGIS